MSVMGTSHRWLLALVAGAQLAACSSESSTETSTTDTGTDTGTGGNDSGSGADVAVDTTPVIRSAEHLFYAVRRRFTTPAPGAPASDIAVVDEDCEPDACEPTPITGGTIEPSFACTNGCVPLSDLSGIVFSDPIVRDTLRYAPLGPDFAFTAQSTVIATGVSEYQVGGSKVAFRVGQDVKAWDSASQATVALGTVGDQSGGFTLSSNGELVFLNRVTLTTMDVFEVSTAGGSERLLQHFVSGQERGTGSYYSGREQMALSPNGKLLAVVTQGLTSTTLCESNTDCDAANGFACLLSASPKRCVAQQLVVNIINREAAEQLDAPCFDAVDCGAEHTCDLTAPAADGTGLCIPRQILLGPSGPSSCSTLTLGEYEAAVAKMAWRDDRSLLVTGRQECIGAASNILVTDLVAVSLDGTSPFTRLIENPGQAHPGPDCYDEIRQEIVPENCFVQIQNMAVSPTGRTVAFAGTKPSARSIDMLWRIDSYGERKRELMTDDSSFSVLSITLHSRP